MSVADRLTKLTTDITSAYTSIENKGGTIPANKNTNNLPTAIDSIEVIEQATAEGESLSLANTKAMPYSDYVVEGKSTQDGEPSPSNPSEIHSVADDVNLFDINSITEATYINSAGNTGTSTVSNLSDYMPIKANNTYSFQYDYSQLASEGIRNYCLYNNNKTWLSGYSYVSSNKVITFTPTQDGYVRIAYDKNCTDIKLAKGTVATPYSPYNQGTVTIKQRGKNLYNNNDTIATENATINKTNTGFEYTRTSQTSSDMFVASNTKMLKPNTVYTVYFRRIVNNTMYFYSDNLWGTSLSKEILKSDTNYYIYKITTNSTGKVVMGFYSANQTTGDTGNISDIMILEGVFSTLESIGNYELYQANDYTIQTKPLRSLPNGVKDTIEEDGIHRRVGRVVLDGTEIWTNKNITDNNLLFSTDKIDNLFNTTNLTNIISNYFGVNSNLWTNDNEGTCLFNMGASLRFRINKNLLNDISTVANAINSMKTWLSNNPTEVLYQLKTETIEPLTQNQATTMLDIIKTGSYEGTTNIDTDEDVKPTIGVEYYKKS